MLLKQPAEDGRILDRLGAWWATIHGAAKSQTQLSDFCVCVCVCVCESLGEQGLDKDDVVHIHNGILLSIKREQNNAFCSNMDGPGDHRTK